MPTFTLENFSKWIEWSDKNKFSPKVTQMLKDYKDRTDQDIIETKDIFNKTRIPEEIKNILFNSKRGDEFMLLTKKYEKIHYIENISYLFPEDEEWIKILTSLFNSDRKIEEIEKLFYLIISSISKKIITIRNNDEWFTKWKRIILLEYINKNIDNPNLEEKLRTNIDTYLEKGYMVIN